ncbi:D-aminoacylase [Roseovarius albus]|uniref:D-aminoacylase n=1 Tax=Roseovarius albus TaxID=1247867 RepID=A0A1X6YD59_9RHOB|nr:D-aminoacylase [Roseovarius albus]SLN17795.1 D-aminoacylase [Roseovarius albus]
MQRCDVLLTGGTVIDGTGAATRRADVAIESGRILHIGDCSAIKADAVIDVTGQVVAPGFIDVHTHDDWALLATPDMAFKVTQGVTSVVAGNCGISAAPFSAKGDLPAPFDVIPGISEGRFDTVAGYAKAVTYTRPAVNVRLLAGHSSLRASVMGGDLERSASGSEIEAMRDALELALRQGAAGLSSGLDYPAALSAPMEEMVQLAGVLKGHERAVYTSHMRDESDTVIASVRETLETGQRSGARVVISHHKCAGKANFGKSVETLKLIDAARRDHEVALDVYPYVASSTSLIERFLPSADDIKVIWSTPHPEQDGRMLNDIAADWGVSREKATSMLQPAGAIYFDMDEGDLQRIMQHPAAMIGSDGLPGVDKPHPRLWGTFPRVLGRYVRELKLLELTQAIHKMTGLSAAQFGLNDRGVVREGYVADLVVFDPEQVADLADFDHPTRPSRGINHVMVNGALALTDGQQTTTRAGAFLT